MPAFPASVPTRERILYAAAELFRRQGYAATGLKQVVGEAEAPFGSLYHHFPGGKEQLGEDVLRAGGAFFLVLFVQIADEAPDVTSAVERFFEGAARTLRDTDYADACPIATVAGEVASTHERLRESCAEVFESWLTALAGRLTDAGVGIERARAIALSVLALLEGAFLLSRSLRSIEPMRAAAGVASGLVATAVAS